MRLSPLIALTMTLAMTAACGDDGGTTNPTNLLTDTASDTSTDTVFVTDTGADTGNDTGADTGPDTGNDTGSDTGNDTGADTGSDTGADTGSDTGNDTGSDTGNDTGSDTGNDTGSDTGNDTGSDTGNDTGTDTSSDTTVTDTGTDTTVTPCGTATLAGDLVSTQNGLVLDTEGDLGFGGPLPDIIIFQLFTDAEGTFELDSTGVAGNENYATCEQCILVLADIDETTQEAAATLFQTQGTLQVSGTGDAVSLTLSGANFVEVTIADVTFTSTPTAGGICTDYAGPGTFSLPQSVCETVDMSGDLVADATDPIYQVNDGTDLGFGGALPDVIQVEFYVDAEGSFDLASADNSNYETCSQCVRVFVDFDATTDEAAFQLFQSAGTLEVVGLPTSGDATLTLSDANLVEITFADESITSVPVPGGACVNDPGPSTLSIPACVPSCPTNAVCGGDGCGGPCGAGCTGADACALDQLSCGAGDTLTLQPSVIAGDGNTDTFALFSQALVPATDSFIFQLYGPPLPTVGSYDLTAAAQANFATCSVCTLVTIGDLIFFQSAGSVALNAGTTADGSTLNATLTGVELVEVTLDQSTFETTPVPNGAKLIIDSPVTLTAP